MSFALQNAATSATGSGKRKRLLRSEEHTSELQSRQYLVCRLLLEKKKTLMGLFTLVVLSGIYGVVLQHIVPRTMQMQMPLETVYEPIDTILAQLLSAADCHRTAM